VPVTLTKLRLPPCCQWDLCSSGMLHSTDLLNGYQNFGSIYWPHLPRAGQSSSAWPASPLKKGWWVVLKHPQPITNQHYVTYQNSKDLNFNRSSLQASDANTHTHNWHWSEEQYMWWHDYKNYCLLGCDYVRLVNSQPAHDTATNTEWQLPEVVLTQSVSPDDEHDVLETCRELKIKINT